MRNKPQLGASLYVPTTHSNLTSIAAGEKLADIRSLIFCTEDAVADADLPRALENLRKALRTLRPRDGYFRFVRARNPAILEHLVDLPGIDAIDGFVLPKVTDGNIMQYMNWIPTGSEHWIMPTLETREVFRDADMQNLAHLMDAAPWRDRVLSLRIGGNDLLSLLHMRRPRGRTIYETPIGHVIARLATTFLPYGFSLSAPVFEHFGDTETLGREIEADLSHGLIGKTAIHPTQVPIIEHHYRTDQADLEAALRILDHDAPGVFKLHQSMCEPATHRTWAQSILEATQCFGSKLDA
jgi:citrate lyase beta subunit